MKKMLPYRSHSKTTLLQKSNIRYIHLPPPLAGAKLNRLVCLTGPRPMIPPLLPGLTGSSVALRPAPPLPTGTERGLNTLATDPTPPRKSRSDATIRRICAFVNKAPSVDGFPLLAVGDRRRCALAAAFPGPVALVVELVLELRFRAERIFAASALSGI